MQIQFLARTVVEPAGFWIYPILYNFRSSNLQELEIQMMGFEEL